MVKGEKLDFLQVFRAVAAGIVALMHIVKEVSHHSAANGSLFFQWFDSLTFGVDLFFIISGFIMVYTTRNAVGGKADSQAFIKRRLIRIVPVYWFYTSLFVAMVLLSPSVLKHTSTNILHIVGSYLFVPLPTPGTGEVAPILVLGWTLNYEMFFYVVFALLLLAPRHRLIFMLIGLFAVLAVGGIVVPKSLPQIWYWTRSSILEFLYGAIIADLFLRGRQIPVALCWLLVVLGIAIWQMNFWQFPDSAGSLDWRGVLWGIPAALIVGGVALCPPVRRVCSTSRWFVPIIAVGDSSYSLYLAHMFVVRAMTIVIPMALLGPVYPFVYVPLTLLAAIVVSYLSYIWFERPVNEWGKSVFVRRRAAVTG